MTLQLAWEDFWRLRFTHEATLDSIREQIPLENWLTGLTPEAVADVLKGAPDMVAWEMRAAFLAFPKATVEVLANRNRETIRQFWPYMLNGAREIFYKRWGLKAPYTRPGQALPCPIPKPGK